MAINITKISQRMKNKGLLSIEKNIDWEKAPFANYEKHLFYKMFEKINFEAINLFWKADLNKKSKNYKKIKTVHKNRKKKL